MTTISFIYNILILVVSIANIVGDGEPPPSAKQKPSDSMPVVTAIYLECPRTATASSNVEKSGKQANSEKELMVNIRVKPSFHIGKVEKFLTLDEVYDPQRRIKAKLMAPYLIEISRGEPVMMYPLEFSRSVKLEDKKHDQPWEETLPETKTKQKPIPNPNPKPSHQEKKKMLNAAAAIKKINDNSKNSRGPSSPSSSTSNLRTSANFEGYFNDGNASISTLEPHNSRKNPARNDLELSVEYLKNHLKPENLSQNKSSLTSSNRLAISVVKNERKKNGHNNSLVKAASRRQNPHAENPAHNGHSRSDTSDESRFKRRNDGTSLSVEKDMLKNVFQRARSRRRRPFMSMRKKIKGKQYSKKPFSSKSQTDLNEYTDDGDINIDSYFTVNKLPSKQRNYHQFDKGQEESVVYLNTLPKKSSIHDWRENIFGKRTEQGTRYRCPIEISKISKKNSQCRCEDNDESNLKGQIKDKLKPFTKLNMNNNMKDFGGIPRIQSLKSDYVPIKYRNFFGTHMNDFPDNDNDRELSRDHFKYFNRNPQGWLDLQQPTIFKDENLKKKFTTHLDQSKFRHKTMDETDSELAQAALLLHTRKLPESSKKKRSFIIYDDLAMRDTFPDNDFNFEDVDYKPVSADPRTHHIDIEDIQPCSSCGGRNKKRPEKPDSVLSSQENSCSCRTDANTVCSCPSPKNTRAVSDTWYSVFNMSAPLPFLTTKLRIFRKRRDVWMKIAPSITLSSLTGVFANANLSILFSSHVDIFQLEKSLRLQNHQLLIPNDDKQNGKCGHLEKEASNYYVRDNNEKNSNFVSLNINPDNILAVGSDTINLNDLKSALVNLNSRESKQLKDSLLSTENGFSERKRRRNKLHVPSGGVYKIGDLGYFPTTMNLLERCPNDKNRLCLNMLDDKVPAYSIKLKMPFRNNAIIYPNVFKVKITRIITDATTKDALQVSIDLINEGIEAQPFSISVENCALPCAAAKSSVKKVLFPHIGETITFLLPLVSEPSKSTKIKCDVLVKTAMTKEGPPPIGNSATTMSKFFVKRSTSEDIQRKERTIAIRQLAIKTGQRCFCIWQCDCHCMPKLETHESFNVCQKLHDKEQKKAGLLVHCHDGSPTNLESCMSPDVNDLVSKTEEQCKAICDYLFNALILLAIMVLLGLLKAIIGRFFSKKVDRFGFDYAQPGRGYDNSSRWRKFFVNSVFFIVFPFFFWCKCFTPSEEDLLVASTEWQCPMSQGSPPSSPRNKATSRGRCKRGKSKKHKPIDPDEEEEVIWSQDAKERLEGGLQVLNFDHQLNSLSLAFHDGIFDTDDVDEDEEENTKFILQALADSRESLKKLINHTSQPQICIVQDNTDNYHEAEELVHSLKEAQIVYRIFDRPIGNVRNIPYGIKYCVQGYFLPSMGAQYEFINYQPLVQYKCISANGTSIDGLQPPVLLCPKEFSRTYANGIEVLEANDLSVQPPEFVPCINITATASTSTSVFKLTSDQNIFNSSGHPLRWRCLPPAGDPETTFNIKPSQEPCDVKDQSQSQISQSLNELDTEMDENTACMDCQKYTCDTIYE